MSGTTLPSRPFPAVQPLASGAAARALVEATSGFVALLRRAADAAASRRNAMRRVTRVGALREIALTHITTSPSYAADLLAAAALAENDAERA